MSLTFSTIWTQLLLSNKRLYPKQPLQLGSMSWQSKQQRCLQTATVLLCHSDADMTRRSDCWQLLLQLHPLYYTTLRRMILLKASALMSFAQENLQCNPDRASLRLNGPVDMAYGG